MLDRLNGRTAGRCHRAGFTFLEVLIVITIMGILAAMAIPQFAATNDQTAAAAARIMIGDLLYAQNLAIANGGSQMVYVSFTTAGGGSNGGYSIYAQQPLTTLNLLSNPSRPTESYTVSYGSGSATQLSAVQLASLSLGNPSNTVLAFDSLGQPYGCTTTSTPVELTSTGTITLQCGSNTLTLSIEPDTGNITVP